MPAEYKLCQYFSFIACDMLIAVSDTSHENLKLHSKTGNLFYVTVNCLCRPTSLYE